MAQSVAILTGAASGIGRHFAGVLAGRGFRLLLADVRFDVLQQAFTPDEGLVLFPLDVRDPGQWQALLEEALLRFGRIDYLFNIAGVIRPGFILETPLEEIDRHLDINTKGVIYGTRFAGEIMARQGGGHIINIASMAGLAPIRGLNLYSASKFAVRGFSLAASYEMESQGVAVTVVCPDLVDTPMLELQLNYPDEAALSFSGSRRPLRPEDVSRALLRVMHSRPREVMVPFSRGWMAKIGSLFPGLGAWLGSILARKGRRRIHGWKAQGEGYMGGGNNANLSDFP